LPTPWESWNPRGVLSNIGSSPSRLPTSKTQIPNEPIV
jgi:hypothetical protein